MVPLGSPDSSPAAHLRVHTDRMRLLIVEDELKMAALLRRGLREEGMFADLAATGEDAVWLATENEYDAVVLDVMLPDMSGLRVCDRLRAADVWAPILMLTARGEVEDRVAGLDAGADDYLTKPFAFDELLARLRAVIRRGATPRPMLIDVGELRLDPRSRRVWRGSAAVALTAQEFAVLHVLATSPDQVLSRQQLLHRAWDLAYEQRSNVVDVCIKSLRDRVDRPFGTHSIETVRGVGYRLRCDH
jgi:two-component system, OmpR family, response regulator